MEESVLALKCASIAHEELSRLCLGVRVCEGGPEPYCDEPIIDPSFLDGAMDSYNVAGAILDLKFDPGLRDVDLALIIATQIGCPGVRQRDFPPGAEHFLQPESVKHPLHAGRLRSEEHTSELQSLMRISYAVF